MTIDRFETISLYNEMISLSDEDFVYAKEKQSFTSFKNDLGLYIYVCRELLEDLILLEEYELCTEVKKLLNKMESSVD